MSQKFPIGSQFARLWLLLLFASASATAVSSRLTSAPPVPASQSTQGISNLPALGLPTTVLAGKSVIDASAVTSISSLSEVLAMLKNSPAWKNANMSYQAASLNLQTARDQAGLNVGFGGSLGLSKYPWDATEWRNNSKLTLSAGFSVLPWSPALENVRRAERNQQTAAIELRSTRAKLTLQAAQAYAAARRAATAVDLAAAQLAFAERAAQVAQDQNAQGVIGRTVLLERQGALTSAQTALASAKRAIVVASQQLTQMLGRGIELPQDSTKIGPIDWPVGTLDEANLLVRALKARPEIAKAEANVADAQAALATAKREQVLPDLNAGVRVGQLNDGAGGSGNVISSNLNLKTGLLSTEVSVALKDTSELKNGIAFNVGGTFTLLGGGKTGAVNSANLALQQVELGLSTSRQAVVLEVRTRLSEYQNELDNLKPLQTSLERAQQAVSDTRQRAEAGLGTRLEVSQAEINLKQAKNALLNQQSSISLAALKLAQATGDFDPLLSEKD